MVGGSSGFLVGGVLGSTSPFLSPIGPRCTIPTVKGKRTLQPLRSVVPYLGCTLESLEDTKKSSCVDGTPAQLTQDF